MPQGGLKLMMFVGAAVSFSRSYTPVTAGHKVGKYLAFNCVEVGAHCQCVGPASAWGKPAAAVSAQYMCARTCPTCSRKQQQTTAVASQLQLNQAEVDKESRIYETDCRPMISCALLLIDVSVFLCVIVRYLSYCAFCVIFL